jgi:hypothetical protein
MATPSRKQAVKDIGKRFFVYDSQENFNRQNFFAISDLDR